MARGAVRLLAQYPDVGFRPRFYLHVRWRICPFDRVLRFVPERGRLLDIGCGSGLWLSYLALERAGLSLEGVDPDPRKLALAARSRAGAPTLHEGTALDLPEGPFDCISIFDVLYLVPDPVKREILARCLGALAPGGTVVVKELDTTPKWKLFPSMLEEFLAVKVARITHGDRLHFQPIEALAAEAEGLGFADVAVTRVDAGYPHPHVVMTARRPSPASLTVEP
jgi:2-polyprenyl-3-methyl-5-hydroxy-6-metoxy-1,4-benzoquinol methylase